MEFYILKSGICLAIFYGFYKLVLEKESFHVFKRFYLLVSVISAFVIPLITFTEYIEVIPQEMPLFIHDAPIKNIAIEAEPINYLPIILWSIYGLGVLLFSFKFLKNLFGILIKIKQNPKFKNQSFINVLLQDLVIPHTFFDYIFLNKQKFETHQIPKEVLLHEQTHAKQKHSLDVLFIEILHILFWFNPFIYFIKRSIKLNHEFLADQSVIKNGIAPSTYQQILLAFSSNASEPQLANAINYSSIKKRFTVMKTHTTKKALWLRSLILLPLLAILIYSFSEKKVVEKEASEPYIIQQNTKEDNTAETNPNVNYQQLRATLNYNILILINPKGQLLVNDFRVEINNLKNSLNDLTKSLTTEQKDNITINVKYNEAPEKVITKVNTILRELKFLKHNLGETYIYQVPLNPKSATPKETEQLNEIFKKLSLKTEKEREIEQSDLNFIKYMYDKMTEEQKAAAEPFQNMIPPPPPVPASLQNPSKELLKAKKEFEEKAGAYGKAKQAAIKEGKGNFTHLNTQYKEVVELLNTYRALAEKENIQTPPPPPPPPPGKK